MDLGFERAGFEPLLALDLNEVAVETYNWNRQRRRKTARVGDLAATGPDQIVRWWEQNAPGTSPCGIIGGPPCEAFSRSNVHRTADDPRARLPLAYARILRKFNDEYGLDFFAFENAAGLGYKAHRTALDSFLRMARRAGFAAHMFYLDAVNFGVPQYRERLFIVGFNQRRLKGLRFSVPVGTDDAVSVREAIGHLPEPMRFCPDCRPIDIGLHPNHWCMNPKSRRFSDGTLRPGEMRGRSFRVLQWDEPSWTVAYGNREVHVHPDAARRLSVYEAMWLQALAPLYELRGTLSDQIHMVSDAVPPPLAYAVAMSVRQALESYSAVRCRREQNPANGHAEHNGR